MELLYSTLTSISLEEFTSKCSECFSAFRSTMRLQKQSENEEIVNPELQIPHGIPLNSYLYRHTFGQMKAGPWSDQEEKELIDVIYSGVQNNLEYISRDRSSISWGLLSLRIKGRTGYQCLNKYNDLRNKGLIQDISLIPTHITKFEKYCIPGLLPHTERALADSIDALLEDNQFISSIQISKMALELYYDPEHLATKAAIYDCIDHGIPYADENGEINSNVINLIPK